MTWWRRLGNTAEAEQELDAELRFDYEQRVAEHIRAGMSEGEARRAARLEFGGIEQIKEECRDARGLQVLQALLRDVRYALRNMRRSPGFTAVAVMTLAIGIGVNAAVFTITNAVLFKGFASVVRNDRILYISSRRYDRGVGTSWRRFEDWRAQAKSFEGMAAVSGAITEKPGAAPVAILSYGLWERRYGKDQAIVGQTVRMNGASTTVIGVMPQGFSFPQTLDLWVLLGSPPAPTHGSPETGSRLRVVCGRPHGRWRHNRERAGGNGNHRQTAGERTRLPIRVWFPQAGLSPKSSSAQTRL